MNVHEISIWKTLLTFDLFSFNKETRRLIRNIGKKIVNCQLTALFNEKCLNKDILPIHTNIYIYIYMCV